MEYIYIGEIINTHGLKGEIKIRSNFRYKHKIFKIGFKLYINNRKKEVEINSYRKYKGYDIVTLVDCLDINDVLGFKGEKSYINKDDLILETNEYLDEELVGLDCYDKETLLGEVIEIINNGATDIFVVNQNDNNYFIPYVDEFIEKIDIDNKKIFINNIKGLIDEN
jgi:16S rRNA processing protein RimM